jgi:exodeoxyribonuclease VII small subunit
MMENKPLRYDEKIQRIEEIITRLQKEELSLETAVALYEEARRLIQECENFLNSLEAKYFHKVDPIEMDQENHHDVSDKRKNP